MGWRSLIIIPEPENMIWFFQADGSYAEAELRIVKNNTVKINLHRKCGSTRFLIEIKNGKWIEKAYSSADGKNWEQVFEMDLTRTGQFLGTISPHCILLCPAGLIRILNSIYRVAFRGCMTDNFTVWSVILLPGGAKWRDKSESINTKNNFLENLFQYRQWNRDDYFTAISRRGIYFTFSWK